MRQGSNPRRSRGRGQRKPHFNPRQQTFDSNGPDVRVRGNAYQVLEKYLALARDASSAGDRIAAENFLQHAEHYYRLINAYSGDEQNQHRNRQMGRPDGSNPVENDDNETEGEDGQAVNGVAKAPEPAGE
jgi:hypothetical protein